MLVEINLETCLNNNITPNQYTILFLLFKKNYGVYHSFLEHIDIDKEFEHLVEVNFVIEYKKEFKAEEITLNYSKLKAFFEYEESYFYELLSVFPLKVINNGAIRYVRPADCDSKKAKDLKSKYERVIKTKAAHDNVIKCLEIEKSIRLKSGSLPFIQDLSTWINQRTWEQYQHLLNQEKELNTEGNYGEEVI